MADVVDREQQDREGEDARPRAPREVARAATVTATHSARASAAASGATASIPPAKVMTDLPPRKPAKSGNAWPTMAAATAA